jgi:hypothetical protein
MNARKYRSCLGWFCLPQWIENRSHDDAASFRRRVARLQKAGLSTWRAFETAVSIGGKGQKIDVAKLDPTLLGCFQDEHGHVSIVPVDANGNLDMMKLTEWAATRGSVNPHSFTTMVVKAIVERNIRRPS